MKFDKKKVADMLYRGKFDIQDHDNKFHFYGIFKSIKLDELTFYITGQAFGSIVRGTYTFPIGSNFTLRKMKFDVDNTKWIYTGDIISWKDITETDDDDSVKEENNMTDEEKNVTELLPCVVPDGAWKVNECISNGDHIYRIFNDKFDIKANMTIKSLGWSKISLHLLDMDVDISNIEVDESLRVCQTSSENDPGTLVMKQNLNFNKAFRPGCLYRIIDSSLNLQYLMYIRCFNGRYIDADIMKPMIILPKEVIDGVEYSTIETKHEQLSIIDLKGMMFNQIYFTEGCHLKIE